MGRVFFILDSSSQCTIPSLKDLEEYWKCIPGEQYKQFICLEMQSNFFMSYLSENIRHADFKPQYPTADSGYRLIGTPKAGFIFNDVIYLSRVLEAVLLSHGLVRNLFDEEEAKKLTLGRLIEKWKEQDDFKRIQKISKEINELRNRIHPENICNTKKHYEFLLTNEERIIKLKNVFLTQLQHIQSKSLKI